MKKVAAVLAFMLVAVSGLAYAHSGGTDKNGCHIDHKTGIKHCH